MFIFLSHPDKLETDCLTRAIGINHFLIVKNLWNISFIFLKYTNSFLSYIEHTRPLPKKKKNIYRTWISTLLALNIRVSLCNVNLCVILAIALSRSRCVHLDNCFWKCPSCRHFGYFSIYRFETPNNICPLQPAVNYDLLSLISSMNLQ